MKNLGLAKKALLLALCASLAVPAGGLGLAPLTAQASPQVIEGVGSGSGEASAQSETNTQNNTDESTKSTNTSNGTATPQVEDPEGGSGETTEELVTDAQKRSSKRVLISHYNIKKSLIEAAGNGEAALQYLQSMIGDISKPDELGGTLAAEMYTSNLTTFETDVKAQIDSYTIKPEAPQEDPQPSTTNSNIMVGGNWVTPVANAGQQVNVVLPVVNMGRSWVDHVVVTPQISSDPSVWPFEIETSNYSQTIEGLPGTDDGGSDMDRRRELTWTLRTRKDAPSGYMPINFVVSYEDENNVLSSVTLTTYVNVVGTTGMSADGKASTPRVIVTGFSTDPETVHAGDTFTLTLHMQNTSKATAVKNMVFDIQAASESTDTTYVAAAFLPTAGSSTIFVDQIAPGASKDISMEMEARADLAQKPYVVNVKMNYEDENVNAYENTASVSIPVRQEARIDTSSIEVMPESIEVGSEANVMFSIYNIGKTQLYNTTVRFVADSVTGGETYLGNIAPGATGNVDAYLSGAAATMDEGVVKIEITFEDEAGEATTVEKEMNLYVSEPFYPEMDMDMMADPMVEESGGFKLWYVLVPLAVVIVAVIVFVVIRFRKKKKAQAEEIAALDDELGGLDDVSLDDDNIDDGMEEADGDETGSKEKE
ncbi:MAG TPA: hypothetical protein IAB61_08065 [Candidatus Merdisoma merdipullorum]|nr:hypothetical protein [Candidatus Merdisoma merdipullorum]